MNAQLIGAAGVFYVASELSMRGLVALPSIRNVKGADILIANQEGTEFALLQVKTSKSKVTFWPIGEGARQWKGRDCYYVVNVKYFSYPRGKDISHEHGKDISHPCGKQISHPLSE